MSTPASRSDSPVIVALDYADQNAALQLIDYLSPSACKLKVGKEMFTRFGPAFVQQLQQRGFQVFLDLKFHDIPNTVASAVAAAADLGVWMVNVHASGGPRMMEAARERLLSYGDQAPLLIAVTVLTSMQQDDLQQIGCPQSPAARAAFLATLAQQSGMDGVVCSALEAAELRTAAGADFKLVTPGIRPAGSPTADQRRIMTPRAALEAGADYLVIGRPITRAADPLQALQQILASLGEEAGR